MTYVVSFIEVVENCLMNNDISKKNPEISGIRVETGRFLYDHIGLVLRAGHAQPMIVLIMYNLYMTRSVD